ncbi:MAG TPA: hypothetical protein VK014_02030 [Cyclobacteriaceae bacterium]|nr:hypothetical protein [Cyclobacteriaceae bacterium]
MRTIFGVLRTGASILWERFEKCSWKGSSIFGSSEACPLPHKHPRSDSSAHDYLTSILGFIKTSPHLLNGSSLSSGIIRYYILRGSIGSWENQLIDQEELWEM